MDLHREGRLRAQGEAQRERDAHKQVAAAASASLQEQMRTSTELANDKAALTVLGPSCDAIYPAGCV